MKNKKIKCDIYTRVSTTMQVDGYSLDAQKEKLKRYAEFQNMEIVNEYSDEGKSGKSVEGRPEFQRMLDNIENGTDEVQFVLVFNINIESGNVPNKKFCNRSCRKKYVIQSRGYSYEWVWCKCQYCGKDFQGWDYRKFCSRVCAQLSREKPKKEKSKRSTLIKPESEWKIKSVRKDV